MAHNLKRSFLIASLAAASCLSTAAAKADQTLPSLPIETYQLPNGLKVILHEDHTTPVVSVNVWYHVGSKDEAARRNGFAHLFEHLMFQGSKHVAEDTFFRHLEGAGASNTNGTTSDDRTNYYETVPTHQLELALWLESDRMGFLLDHVDQATFESQRNVVKNERRQNYEDAPYGLVPKFLREAQFPVSHPYHNLTIGSYEDLDAASLEDVKDFYKTYYLPNNASLVITGDISSASTKTLVEKYFGPVTRGSAPAVITNPIPATIASEITIPVEASVELPRVYIAYVTPPFFAPGDAALDALSQVLSGGKTSRLYKRLVYDLQIATDVHAYQASSQLASTFEIVATAKPGHTAEELLKIIDEELLKISAEAPSDRETSRAKTALESSLIYRIERMGDRADMFNTYAQYTGDANFFSKDVARYRSLGANDLKQAAAQYLPKAHRVIALVSPNPQAPKAGRIKEGSK